MLVFDVNGFLLFREEGADPAVVISLGAVTAVVLVGRDDQFLGGIVSDGVSRSVTHEPPGVQFVVNGIVNRLLLFGRERAPELFALRVVEVCHPTAIGY